MEWDAHHRLDRKLQHLCRPHLCTARCPSRPGPGTRTLGFPSTEADRVTKYGPESPHPFLPSPCIHGRAHCVSPVSETRGACDGNTGQLERRPPTQQRPCRPRLLRGPCRAGSTNGSWNSCTLATARSSFPPSEKLPVWFNASEMTCIVVDRVIRSKSCRSLPPSPSRRGESTSGGRGSSDRGAGGANKAHGFLILPEGSLP